MLQKEISLQFFTLRHVWKIACSDQVRSTQRGRNVSRNKVGVDSNDGTAEKRGLEHSSYTPTDFDFAEVFGGAAEYFTREQSSLGLLSSIRILSPEGD